MQMTAMLDQPAGKLGSTQRPPEPQLVQSPESQNSANPEQIITYIAPRKISKKPIVAQHDHHDNLDQPLVDTTEILPKRSRKTERAQRQKQKKLQKSHVKTTDVQSFLDLPSELLEEILSYLFPSDIVRLLRLNKATAYFIREHRTSIARDIIRQRFATLFKAFYRPTRLGTVDPRAQAALLSPAWQQRVLIHKRPYQHVAIADAERVCSCVSCVMAWNNLCLILDLAHFQRHLAQRDIIPRIAPGDRPAWNLDLTARSARIVDAAIDDPLIYAWILEQHLATTVATLTRQARVGKHVWSPPRLFALSDTDVAAGTDGFLEREGPPSYEFPFHRDRYLDLQAYVPNRMWQKESGKWRYATPGQPHDTDVAWITARFSPIPESGDGLEQFVASFASQLQT